jgi:hypothetical protein
MPAPEVLPHHLLSRLAQVKCCRGTVQKLGVTNRLHRPKSNTTVPALELDFPPKRERIVLHLWLAASHVSQLAAPCAAYRSLLRTLRSAQARISLRPAGRSAHDATTSAASTSGVRMCHTLSPEAMCEAEAPVRSKIIPA